MPESTREENLVRTRWLPPAGSWLDTMQNRAEEPPLDVAMDLYGEWWRVQHGYHPNDQSFGAIPADLFGPAYRCGRLDDDGAERALWQAERADWKARRAKIFTRKLYTCAEWLATPAGQDYQRRKDEADRERQGWQTEPAYIAKRSQRDVYAAMIPADLAAEWAEHCAESETRFEAFLDREDGRGGISEYGVFSSHSHARIEFVRVLPLVGKTAEVMGLKLNQEPERGRLVPATKFSPGGWSWPSQTAERCANDEVLGLITQALDDALRIARGERASHNKFALVQRDGLRCNLCGEDLLDIRDVVMDHVVPFAPGGVDTMENLQVAHEGCNGAKSDSWAGSLDHDRLRIALAASPKYKGEIRWL